MAKGRRSKSTTRKQQNWVEKENRQRKIVLFSTIAVIAVVALIIGYGVLNVYVIQPRQPVAVVNGTKITLQDFETRVRYDRYQKIQNTVQLEQYNQMFGSDPSTGAGYFDSQIQQNLTDLNSTTTMGNQAIEELINDAVIAQKAKEMGITVSDVDVDKAIQEAFGYYANGTPTASPTVGVTPFSTATYSPQQLTLEPYTATPTITQTPTITPTPTGTLAPTEVPPTATPTIDPNAAPTETGTPGPTATPYTLAGFQSDYQNYVSSLTTDAQLTDTDMRAIFRASLLYKKVNEEVNKTPPTTDEYIWARHILVSSQDDANTVEAKLKSRGRFHPIGCRILH